MQSFRIIRICIDPKPIEKKRNRTDDSVKGVSRSAGDVPIFPRLGGWTAAGKPAEKKMS